MKRDKLVMWLLVVLFAGFMSVPFLVPHCGFFALFGFVPLLCMNRIANLAGVRHVWVYHYAAFFLWNAATTFWVCNATIGGGIFAVAANAMQMSVIFAVFRLSERKFRGILPYIFLAVMWIAWEHIYFDASISWPWLVLGNAFARSVASVQWYEYTGCLGGSLWIWLVNITLYRLMAAISDGSTARWNGFGTIVLTIWIILIVAGPFVVSRYIYDTCEETDNPLEVKVFQPNIDPYHKFELLTQKQQTDILLAQMEAVLGPKDSLAAKANSAALDSADSVGNTPVAVPPLLLLAPETFTSDIVVGQWDLSVTYRRLLEFLQGRPGVNILFGASARSYTASARKPSYSARQLNDGRWVESHNSALMIDGTGRTEICHKNMLVVGVEKLPYPAVFAKVDDWLGGVMGRCVGQDGVTVFNCCGAADTVKVGCAICYESVYGEYYTQYARAGAEVMAIITNDAWWGDTPGYRQHLSYASLRAIETRRDIARCANTGISAFINQRGEIREPSAWWQPAVLQGRINRNTAQTFFVQHGDIAGRVCCFLFCLLFLALIVQLIISGGRRREDNHGIPQKNRVKYETPSVYGKKGEKAHTPK
ncbi:MAG: apolipoprotein N-acyltransferase [Bacteroidales bacterium]|nr:apolipoprotein N-acyltransferase [Bacteroidales bacterium]